MKAMTAARYGGPETMQLEEVPTPTIGDGEVLVAVRATSLQALDWHLLRADPAVVRLGEGLFRPKRTIHGVDIAGIIEAVGASVDDLGPGDEVSGWSDHGGGLAESFLANRVGSRQIGRTSPSASHTVPPYPAGAMSQASVDVVQPGCPRLSSPIPPSTSTRIWAVGGRLPQRSYCVVTRGSTGSKRSSTLRILLRSVAGGSKRSAGWS
jgi:NADPH:quinone reductase-like Zn-dependent oxidoreductase